MDQTTGGTKQPALTRQEDEAGQRLTPTHLLLVLYDCVDFGVGSRIHEVSVEDGLARHHLVEVAVELLDAVLQQVVEPVPVLAAHQTVTENPAAFVVPQMQQRGFVLTC